ncbi:MAG: A/G-specific adenine glycosylase [Phycisphaerales bacterium JB060]
MPETSAALSPDHLPVQLPAGTPKIDRRWTRTIARWFSANARSLPWRTTPRDPWLSLMSEIMLQQTQAKRVAERFDAFAGRFPTPAAMARASVDDVLAMWSGLGYYRRARLLHACACDIVHRYEGAVPQNSEDLRTLPGVGRYTAGAVASIAFGRPEPIVDGNVSRVLLRVHGVRQPPDGPGVQAWAWQRATDLARAAGGDVARTNEGLMELGATVCTPAAPACGDCPMRTDCVAFQERAIGDIPAPKTRAVKKPLAISALVITDQRGRILLEQRPPSGLWGGLWQPPNLERPGVRHASLPRTTSELGLDGLIEATAKPAGFGLATTHRDVRVRVWTAKATDARLALAARPRGARWVYLADLASLGLGAAQHRMLHAGGLARGRPRTGVSRRTPTQKNS